MSGIERKAVRDVITTELRLLLEQGSLKPEDEDHILGCLEKAYGHLEQLRARNHIGVKAWLGRILRNVKADAANRESRYPQTISLTDLVEVGQEPGTLDTDPATIAAENEQLQHSRQVHATLEEILEGLPPATAELFRSRFYERVSFAEIGAGLQISEEAAMMRYRRLRQRVFQEVAKRLRRCCPETIDFFAPDG